MRNLSTQWTTTTALPPTHEDDTISTWTIDLDEDALYVISELVEDANVVINVWRGDKDLEPFTTATLPAAPSATSAQVVAAFVLPDTRDLCLVTRAGDIVTVPLGGDEATATVVGTVTPGIAAASLAPDSSLLTLVTSAADEPLLILMHTPALTIASEAPLHTAAPGAAQPVSAGWGSKSTQFHGSLGKAAAQATLGSTTGTPDDDGRPRLAWRGDAQFFAVSAPAAGAAGARRVLRVYDRAAALQSTAEPVAGLEHPLAWRPSGALLASTQRFGAVPPSCDPSSARGAETAWALGQGRDERHDVVFFERNGLRHGEFTLREPPPPPPAQNTTPAPPERRWGYRVCELAWNADSSVLAVWLDRHTGHAVQLWTTGNYHWYLKLELPAPRGAPLTHVAWHAEDPARLVLSTRQSMHDVRLARYTAASFLPTPHDTGLVAVIDGADVLLTPFRTKNVPPPLAGHKLTLGPASPASPTSSVSPASPPAHIALSHTPPRTPHADTLAILSPTGSISLYSIASPPRGITPAPVLRWSGTVPPSPAPVHAPAHASAWPRQLAVHGYTGPGEQCTLAVLTSDPRGADELQITRVCDGAAVASYTISLPSNGARGRLVDSGAAPPWPSDPANPADPAWTWHTADGTIWQVARDADPVVVARFPRFCAAVMRVVVPVDADAPEGKGDGAGHAVFVGLSGATLYAAPAPAPVPAHYHDHDQNPSVPATTLSKTCTSFAPAVPFLVWTETAPAHEAVFVPLAALLSGGAHAAAAPTAVPSAKTSPVPHTKASAPPGTTATSSPPTLAPTAERRRIERGARIVTAVPSASAVVLQMPRGNLETIMPRALVLERVRADVMRGEYGKAFLAARKHRVDLALLVTTDPARFARSIKTFVTQLDDVEHLNLFLTELGRSAEPPEVVAQLCDAIRAELETTDVRRYVRAVLTAHVVKHPPAYEDALALLLRLREEDPGLVEDAVKYVIFLVDADRLFDTALGMYDFSLVLLVAQFSQKDPREYLPLLRSLRAHEGAIQHFKIDDHLRRHAKALRSLCAAGAERFEEARAYVVRHSLFLEGLALWKDEGEERCVMFELYGDYLFERREFAQAALAFAQGKRMRKAMVAYEKGLEWQALFDLALRDGVEGAELVATARRVADDLDSKRRHADAARVLLDYADDVDEAVAALVRGGEWAEARRLTTLRKRADLVEAAIMPGTLDARAALSEEMGEVDELRAKQVARLDELEAKKTQEPDAFYGVEDANLANVDIMTDVSNPGTMFTRYTVAPSASSARSKRTSRSKRKLERKAGRKGTVEEEEYLLRSLTKLVTRFDTALAEACALLPQLLMLSEEHVAEARALHAEIDSLESSLRRDVERVWDERSVQPPSLPQEQAQPHDGHPTAASPSENLVEKVPRPAFADISWRVRWIAD